MKRLLMGPAILLTLAFCGALWVVRAAPRDDRALRAFFAAPDDCARPCWQGIRPGATLLEGALAILRAHPWVRHITLQADIISSDPTAALWWDWSGRQPAYIDATTDGRLTASQGVVEYIVVSTTVPMGDARAVLGPPLRGKLEKDAVMSRRVLHLALYEDLGVQNLIDCPIRVADLWREPAQIELYGNWATAGLEPYALADWLADPPC